MTTEKDLFFKKAWAGEIDNLRPIAKDEIVLEYDNVTGEEGLKFSNESLEKLEADGYRAVMYDHGGKSPHIHISNISGLGNLRDDVRLAYKEAFIKKYSVDDRVDLSLASTRKLIATPNKLHYKVELEGKPYGIKKEVAVVNDLNDGNKLDQNLLNEILKKKIVKSSNNENIISVAEEFGLVVEKDMALCPFHADTSPSLKFYPENGSFFCFGCKQGGNISWFIKLMNGIKKNDERFRYKKPLLRLEW